MGYTPKMTVEQVKAIMAKAMGVPPECLPEPICCFTAGVVEGMWRFPPFAPSVGASSVEGPMVWDGSGRAALGFGDIGAVLSCGPVSPMAQLERERAEFDAKLAEAESRALKWNGGMPEDDREVMVGCVDGGKRRVRLAHYVFSFAPGRPDFVGRWVDRGGMPVRGVKCWSEVPKFPEDFMNRLFAQS